MKTLEEQGVEFPTDDVLLNEEWLNKIYRSASAKAIPTIKAQAPAIFMGVVEMAI